jgi:diguanylate cyclase (GGDEF)-like protein/PAS domain S-box-containing protein
MTQLVAVAFAFAALVAGGWYATVWVRHRLRKSDARFHDAVERRYNLLEAIPDGLYIVDRNERITLVNEEAERLLRATSGELVGQTLVDIVGPLASDIVPELRRARALGETVERTLNFRATETTIELRIKPGARETLVYLRDISERSRADVRLRESEGRLRLLMGQVPALLWTIDRHEIITSATGVGVALVETRGTSCVGRPFSTIFRHGEASAAIERALRGEPVQFESVHTDRWLRHDVEALRDSEGALIGAIGVALDVTEMRNTQLHLAEIARRDSLTGLPNRFGLEENLGDAIAAAARNGESFAVLFVDLDRFKTINDTLGHRAGDSLLRGVAERLSAALQPGDSIARPGGDEFIIVSRNIHDHEDVRACAARIHRRIAESFAVDGRELYVGASIGAAVYPDHATTPEQLIQLADVAMYKAKSAGRGTYALFDGGMQAASLERLALESDLRQALARNEFTVVYQPFVGPSRRIVGCEALLRWRLGEEGEVPSGRFIGMAEEMGLIVEITRWVLEQACTFAASIRRERPDFRMNVNISGRDLYDANLAYHVAQVLERTGLPPSGLELEVTESVLLDDRAIASLDKIRALGVRIAVDDFGVSYSVLSSIKRLPITTLKIDRSFVDGVVTSILDQAICKAIVTLGKSLGLRIVAEGVETEGQMRFVSDLEVDEIQGYYTGRPVTATAFLETIGKVIPLERAVRRA